MNNAPAILKSLIIYAICVPVAVVVGYMLTDPLNYTTFAYVGVVAVLLIFPLLLRWHYPLLLFSINTNMMLFFMQGLPNFWLVMVTVSLGISMVDRALNSQKQFIRVPQMTWPLICMISVVLFTAKMTGGIGLHAFGSDVYGGKKYIFLIVSILSYFAVTARRIPLERANLYMSLYLLGGLTLFISDFYPIAPGFLRPIFWIFPPSGAASMQMELGRTRLGGVAGTASTIAFCMMAIYGLRGILFSGKLWRPVLFGLSIITIFLGGFRSSILAFVEVFGLLFFLEGLHRTRLLLVFTLAGVLMAVAIVPLAPHLPFTFQRSLSFLPLKISADARQDAEGSSEWRIKMWKALLPEVPQYLLLGKGYALTAEDAQLMGKDTAFHSIDESQQGLALSSDFHNGPLTVVIPFGIWGVIAVLWLMFAGLRVTYCNFRYGDESLRKINTYLWASYLSFLIRFLFIVGSLSSDMLTFVTGIGISVALNGGVCRPAPRPIQARQPAVHPSKILPHTRPAFQR